MKNLDQGLTLKRVEHLKKLNKNDLKEKLDSYHAGSCAGRQNVQLHVLIQTES